MLDHLRAINDLSDDDIFFESLRQLQPYVTNLRYQYSQSPSHVDFSCRHTRAAYLLAYYPHYIEPIYETLSQFYEVLSVINQPQLRVCFIGAGPAPEALGLAAFVNKNCDQTNAITGYLLDKFVDGWRLGQEITQYHLVPQYLKHRPFVFRPVEFDFLDESCLNDPFTDRAINHSHLFIMQNCLNDQLDNPDEAREMVLRIFKSAPLGAIFVVCDLKFDEVRDLIESIQGVIETEEIGTVLLAVDQYPRKITSSITAPNILVLLDHLLIGDPEKKLIPRKSTWYYSAIFQRTEPNEIPF